MQRSYTLIIMHMETKEKYISPESEEIIVKMEGCIAGTGGGEGEEGGLDL